LNMRTTAFGKVKYGLTKIKGNTKYQMMATKANCRALQKEIALAAQANNCSTKTGHSEWWTVKEFVASGHKVRSSDVCPNQYLDSIYNLANQRSMLRRTNTIIGFDRKQSTPSTHMLKSRISWLGG